MSGDVEVMDWIDSLSRDLETLRWERDAATARAEVAERTIVQLQDALERAETHIDSGFSSFRASEGRRALEALREACASTVAAWAEDELDDRDPGDVVRAVPLPIIARVSADEPVKPEASA